MKRGLRRGEKTEKDGGPEEFTEGPEEDREKQSLESKTGIEKRQSEKPDKVSTCEGGGKESRKRTKESQGDPIIGWV